MCTCCFGLTCFLYVCFSIAVLSHQEGHCEPVSRLKTEVESILCSVIFCKPLIFLALYRAW